MKFKQLALVGLPALALGLLIGNLWWNPTTRAYFNPDYWASLGKVGEVMRLIHYRYVDEEKASFDHLSEAAVSELIDGLDKHSRYMSEEDFNVFELDSQKQYFGIGVSLFKLQDQIVITRVFPQGGAILSNVRAGDRILAVESKPTVGLSISEVSDLIRGDEGTTINLLLQDEEGAERKVVVSRGKVQLASVEDVRMMGRVGYLRIDQFTKLTGKEFDSAMARLRGLGMEFLVIDLRSNSGGLLSASIDVLGHFFEKDAEVVSIAGRARGVTKYRSVGKGAGVVPIVVLINPGSASAAEIVAGALKVSGKAILIGEASYGKGTVQTIFSLNDESGMRLTTARYFLPDGTAIGEDGLSPDIEVTCDTDTWRKILLQRDQAPFAQPEIFKSRFGFEPVGDPQLEIALCVLLDQGIEKQLGETSP